MKKLLWLLVAFVMSFGTIGLTSGAAHAGTSLDISVTSVDVGTPVVSLTNTTLATPGGATQLLWWYPNHHIKVTKKAVKHAPKVKVIQKKVNATTCVSTSKKIAKKAHGASVVVLKKGSVVCNTGKNGNIVGGFSWKVTEGKAVLKWNKQLGLYQHVFNWKGHRLIRECGNHMGGHVDKMYSNVVQVRYANELQYTSTVTAAAGATAHANVSGTCPDGTKVDFSLSASGSGFATGSVAYQEKTKTSAVNSKVASLSTQFNASATANATANVHIEANLACGSTPPPPPVQPITITSLTQLNMIPAGKSSGEFSIGVNASAAGGSLTVDPGIGSVSACTDTTGANQQDSMVFSNLGSGNSTLCVILWAPNDADKPASMTVTFTAILGAAKDVKTETVPITYPTRP